MRFDYSPVQHALWITRRLMGTAPGKAVTVMCSEFKDDDTRLYCPVTFWIFTSQMSDCRDQTIKKEFKKRFLIYENKASEPERREH